MAKTYHIEPEIILELFKEGIRDNTFDQHGNGNNILDIITRELPDHAIESIVNLMLLKSNYKEVKIKDYVKVKQTSYHVGNQYEIDVMKDLGLMDKDGSVYGIVTGDTSWSASDPFNPFYSRIKVDLLYHDADRNIVASPNEFSPMALTKITENSINYFKNNNNGKNINELTKEGTGNL